MGGGKGGSSAPPIMEVPRVEKIEVPKPEPLPEREQEAEAKAVRDDERRKTKQRKGITGTRLTQPLGLMNAIVQQATQNKLGK